MTCLWLEQQVCSALAMPMNDKHLSSPTWPSKIISYSHCAYYDLGMPDLGMKCAMTMAPAGSNTCMQR